MSLTSPRAALQAAYAEYVGKDDSGAIAAFLDDDGTSILQARCRAMAQSSSNHHALTNQG